MSSPSTGSTTNTKKREESKSAEVRTIIATRYTLFVHRITCWRRHQKLGNLPPLKQVMLCVWWDKSLQGLLCHFWCKGQSRMFTDLITIGWKPQRGWCMAAHGKLSDAPKSSTTNHCFSLRILMTSHSGAIVQSSYHQPLPSFTCTVVWYIALFCSHHSKNSLKWVDTCQVHLQSHLAMPTGHTAEG